MIKPKNPHKVILKELTQAFPQYEEITNYIKRVFKNDDPTNNYTRLYNIYNGYSSEELSKEFVENLFLEIKKCGRGVTLRKLELVHGKNGKKKWDEYVGKQAETNTFEYKQKKYGITKEEFDDYNKSRAVTLENMIKRHGVDVGTQKYIEYCERQSYAGCSLEYFIEKYGVKEGEQKYRELNLKKSHTPEVYIEKYGEEEGMKRLEEFFNKINSNNYTGKSVKGDKFLDKVDLFVPDSLKKYTYREYAVSDKDANKTFLYDWVNTKLKLCIEYNGTLYHAKPSLYEATDIPLKSFGSKTTAGEIWEYDRVKKESILKNRDKFVDKFYVVWEDDEHTALLELKNLIESISNEIL